MMSFSTRQLDFTHAYGEEEMKPERNDKMKRNNRRQMLKMIFEGFFEAYATTPRRRMTYQRWTRIFLTWMTTALHDYEILRRYHSLSTPYERRLLQRIKKHCRRVNLQRFERCQTHRNTLRKV